MGGDPNAAWKNKIQWCSDNNYFKELNRIDGVWTIFPGFTSLGILEEIQKLMESIQSEPEHFNGTIIFMSMFDDIGWRESKYARRFPRGRWSFLGPGSEKKW